MFLGSAAALVCTSAIAVLAGEAVARTVPAHWLQRGAGILFLLLGLAFLMGSRQA